MSNPPRQEFRDHPVLSSFSAFDTVGAVRAALNELEEGVFQRSAQLVDRMGRDDRIRAALETRIRGLLGQPLSFEEQGDKRRKSALVRELDERFWTFAPESEVGQLLRWGLTIGVGLAENVWERGPRRWEPRLKVWHPEHLRWDWTKRRFVVSTQDGDLTIEPGDPKWVVFEPFGTRGWMHGLVRALAIPWLVRQWAYRDWARYSEVHGLPIRKAVVPSNASDADKTRFFDSLKRLGSESTVLAPAGQTAQDAAFDLELVEAEANTWEGFDRLIGRTESSISIAVLGQNLTTEVQGGSRAAAEVHDRVRNDLVESDGEQLATCLHVQVLQPWAEFNYGSGDDAPWPCWETEPPIDTKARADTLNAAADALNKFRTGGVPVDVQEYADEFELELIDGAPIGEPPTPAPTDAPPKQLSQGEDDPEGLPYADRVGDEAVRIASDAVAPDLAVLLKAIDEATSLEQLQAALPGIFESMDPSALASVSAGSEQLAELAGRRAMRRRKA
jgi:phage gp29-like protein